MLDKPPVLEAGIEDENHLTSWRSEMPRFARLTVKEEKAVYVKTFW